MNYVDDKQNSPLLIAVETNNLELIILLLENGANPNMEETYTNAIDIAVEATKNDDTVLEDSTEIIELLLKYGDDMNQKDIRGKSAVDFAKYYHKPAQRLFEQIIPK